MRKRSLIYLFLIIQGLALHTICSAQKKHQKQPVKKDVQLKSDEKDADKPEEPKDTVKVEFGDNIVNLRTFDGYNKNNKGKWIHSPNRIPYENPDFNNDLYDKYKIGFENINQINIDQIYIDSVPYLAFMIESTKGFYRDSEKTDFKYYTAADYFLVSPDDFLKLWNDSMKIGHPYQANLRAYYSGLVGYKDLKLRTKYMSMEINKDLRNLKYTDTAVKIYLQFGMLPVQNKNGRFMKFYYGLEYARLGQPIAPFDNTIFKKRYYEANLDLFHRFCRPKYIVQLKHTPVKVVPKPVKKPEPPEEKGYIID